MITRDREPIATARRNAGDIATSVGAALAPGLLAPAPAVGTPSSPASTPPPATGPTAPSPVPSDVEALTVLVAELVREVRATRAAPQPMLSNHNNVMVALIEASARVTAAQAEADGRAATAHAEAQARAAENNMKVVLTLIGQRNTAVAAPAAAPAESTKVALELLEAMHNVMKGFQAAAVVAAPPATTFLDHIRAFKALRDLSGGGAPPSEFQPLVDPRRPVIAAEAAKTSAPGEHARPAHGPRGHLEYVRDVGMVEVVAPERRPETQRRGFLDEVAGVARHEREVRPQLLRAIPQPRAAPLSAVSAPPTVPVPMLVEPAPRVLAHSAPEQEASRPPDPLPHDKRSGASSATVAEVIAAVRASFVAAPTEPPVPAVALEARGNAAANPRTPVDAVLVAEAPPVSSSAASSGPPTAPVNEVEGATPPPPPTADATAPTPVPPTPKGQPVVLDAADRGRAEHEVVDNPLPSAEVTHTRPAGDVVADMSGAGLTGSAANFPPAEAHGSRSPDASAPAGMGDEGVPPPMLPTCVSDPTKTDLVSVPAIVLPERMPSRPDAEASVDNVAEKHDSSVVSSECLEVDDPWVDGQEVTRTHD